MSRSRVIRGYPRRTIAIPPMTTKSIPDAVSLRRISLASSGGHSAGIRSLGSIGSERPAAELLREPIERLESTHPLVGRLSQAGSDQRLVEAMLLVQIELEAVPGRGHHPLEGREPRVRPGGFQASDLRLLHARALRQLGLR